MCWPNLISCTTIKKRESTIPQPENAKPPFQGHAAFQTRPAVGSSPELIPLLSLTEEEFRERFRRSPIKRAKRAGLLRNVCVALGNSKDPQAIPALITALHER